MFLEMAYLCSYVVSKKRRVNLICFGGWSVSKSPRQQFNKATWNQFGQGCYLKPLASQLKSLAHSFLVFWEETKRNALWHSIQFGIAHGVWPLTLGYLRCPAEPFSASLEDWRTPCRERTRVILVAASPKDQKWTQLKWKKGTCETARWRLENSVWIMSDEISRISYFKKS